MAEDLIISISGMRGIVGENLTSDIAGEYGCSFGTYLKERNARKGKLSVCIGRDSRGSGEMLKGAVAEGLCKVGVNVVDLGIVTTPSVGIMVRELGCDGGLVITASHNPINITVSNYSLKTVWHHRRKRQSKSGSFISTRISPLLIRKRGEWYLSMNRAMLYIR